MTAVAISKAANSFQWFLMVNMTIYTQNEKDRPNDTHNPYSIMPTPGIWGKWPSKSESYKFIFISLHIHE